MFQMGNIPNVLMHCSESVKLSTVYLKNINNKKSFNNHQTPLLMGSFFSGVKHNCSCKKSNSTIQRTQSVLPLVNYSKENQTTNTFKKVLITTPKPYFLLRYF